MIGSDRLFKRSLKRMKHVLGCDHGITAKGTLTVRKCPWWWRPLRRFKTVWICAHCGLVKYWGEIPMIFEEGLDND